MKRFFARAVSRHISQTENRFHVRMHIFSLDISLCFCAIIFIILWLDSSLHILRMFTLLWLDTIRKLRTHIYHNVTRYQFAFLSTSNQKLTLQSCHPNPHWTSFACSIAYCFARQQFVFYEHMHLSYYRSMSVCMLVTIVSTVRTTVTTRRGKPLRDASGRRPDISANACEQNSYIPSS